MGMPSGATDIPGRNLRYPDSISRHPESSYVAIQLGSYLLPPQPRHPGRPNLLWKSK